MAIHIERNPRPVAQPAPDSLIFGRHFTPHMFMLNHRDGSWQDPRIVPYGPLSLDPAAKVLHYAQEIFEGMKAYRNPIDSSVHMFRPDQNIARFNRSAERVCMPPVDPDLFMAALDTLIALDADWVPAVPSSLYIRPTLFGDQPSLGVAASTSYLFYIIVGPVGSYFKNGIKPLRLKAETEFVRSAPGGTGYAKTGGNYAAALLPIKHAQAEGFDQIIWLDAISRRTVEEMGAMNIAFVYADHILTAPLGDTILAGVTRDSIAQLCGDFQIPWVESPPIIATICADAASGKLKECFACGTAAVVTPVGSITHLGHEAIIGGGQEGPVTRRLRESLWEIHTGTSANHPEWIHRVPSSI